MLRFLPLLPPTIPLLGAAALAIIPRRRISDAVRRWIVAGAFLTAWLALALAYSVRAAMQPPSFVGPVLGPSERVWVFFDPLAAHVGLLLLGGGVLLQVAVLDMPIERFHAVCLLVALGSAVVSLTTDSLYVLCVAWGTMDLALMGYSARTMTSQRGATRYLAGGLMSTAALSVALVLALGWQRDTQMSSLALTGAPLAWLAAAALLRLGSYPLPGSFGGSWEVFLLSLCTGGYLWLRVGGLFAPLPPQMGALLPMTGATLLLTGALAALAPDPMSARRYILYNGVSISICAVLLDPQSGSTLALLNLVNLGLG
ncbi:MAG: hypothetical protein FJZ90_15440, partial [Chloroflexi bacterium]|nr:hypothetical protein [Chloroflexota bacterium]